MNMSSYKNYFIIIYAFALGSSFVETRPKHKGGESSKRGGSDIDLTLRLGGPSYGESSNQQSNTNEPTDARFNHCIRTISSNGLSVDLNNIRLMLTLLFGGYQGDQFIQHLLASGVSPVQHLMNLCSEKYDNNFASQYCGYLMYSISQMQIDGARIHCHNSYYDAEALSYLTPSGQTRKRELMEANISRCIESLAATGYTVENGEVNFVIAVSMYMNEKKQIASKKLSQRTNNNTTDAYPYTQYLVLGGGVYMNRLDNNYIFCCLEDLQNVGFMENNVEHHQYFTVLQNNGSCDQIPSKKGRNYCLYISGVVNSIALQTPTALSPRDWCATVVS